MLTFAYPWIFLLAPLPILIHRFIPPSTESKAAVRVPFLSRVTEAQKTGVAAKASRAVAMVTRGTVWMLLLAATARPQLLEDPVARNIPVRDLLLVVDLSGSMEATDFTDESGAQIDRLTAVKQVVGDFLVQRQGDRVGLVVFGNAPYLQAPFTTDLELCRKLLDETAVRMAGPRTALGDAIGLGIQVFEKSDVPEKVMIALTDGNDTGSGVPPVEAARVASDRGVTIHTVAIGDPTTVGEEQLDLAALNEVARETGGQSFLALDRAELQGIYEQLNTIETRKVEADYVRPRKDLYYLPVAGALLISLLSHAVDLRGFIASRSAPAADVRLRVNSRTFDLEAHDR